MSLRSLSLLLLCLVQFSAALKFDLPALSHNGKNERCIRNFVSRDQLVVVTAIVSGSKGDGQVVNMHIKDSMGNDYGRPKDVVGETRQAFTPSADTAFDVCFENILVTGRHSGNPFRHIELDIDIGADARDWSAIQVQEKLRPVEADLRRIEAMVGEIVMEMDYMRIREQKLRDTNESTNERVKWFAFGTMGMLVGLGAWQVVYLRAYFRFRDDVKLGNGNFDIPTRVLPYFLSSTPSSAHSTTIIYRIGKGFLPMATPQLFSRVMRSAGVRLSSTPVRSLSATTFRATDLNDRGHSTAPSHRETQKSRPPNPHLTNTTSTNTNDFPKVGERAAPPDLISAVDPDYKPSDAVPGKTERMTGGTQPSGGRKPELGVGEMEGITFKVEPLKRRGEDVATMRARLLCAFAPFLLYSSQLDPTYLRTQVYFWGGPEANTGDNTPDQSRKRGTLESDLLLSTFASQNLPSMSASQLEEFDKFLDENDWDIYYWATQEPEDPATTTNAEVAAASGEVKDTPTDTWKNGAAKSGEWAQTVGAFKPAYRPVPQRWEESEILARLRQHVRDRSAGGEQSGKGKGKSGGGLGQMPEIHPFES
ncbi:hypothetical protein FQN50_005689 [Emmonsiellopsis sp. PD_5]|nr:hypothetical protein FQN50_005689 [Emmonsiellopsis sp. PD_5]